jgi:hypothetical protein
MKGKGKVSQLQYSLFVSTKEKSPEITALQQQIDKIGMTTGSTATRATVAEALTDANGNGLFGTLSPGGDNVATVDCPQGTYMTGIQGFKKAYKAEIDGTAEDYRLRSPLVNLLYVCRPIR